MEKSERAKFLEDTAHQILESNSVLVVSETGGESIYNIVGYLEDIARALATSAFHDEDIEDILRESLKILKQMQRDYRLAQKSC